MSIFVCSLSGAHAQIVAQNDSDSVETSDVSETSNETTHPPVNIQEKNLDVQEESASEDSPDSLESSAFINNEEEWFAFIDGILLGPYTAEAIANLVLSGKVNEFTAVSKTKGVNDWKTANEIFPDLFQENSKTIKQCSDDADCSQGSVCSSGDCATAPAGPSPVSTELKEWYVFIDNTKKGPYSASEIESQVKDGLIYPNTSISPNKDSQSPSDWKPAIEVFPQMFGANDKFSISKNSEIANRSAPPKGEKTMIVGVAIIVAGLVTPAIVYFGAYGDSSDSWDRDKGVVWATCGGVIGLGGIITMIGGLVNHRHKKWVEMNTKPEAKDIQIRLNGLHGN